MRQDYKRRSNVLRLHVVLQRIIFRSLIEGFAVYMLMLLVMGGAAAGFLMWWRSPMEALSAEMAERVITTRATLEELSPRRSALPLTRPRERG